MGKMTYADLGLGAVDSGEIVELYNKASAFYTAGREVALPLQGAAFGAIDGIEANFVGEGKAKTASGSNSSKKVNPNKLVSVVVFTDEVWRLNTTVANAVYDEQPNAAARKFDLVVAGLIAKPADLVNFSTFAEITNKKTISAGSDASVDFDAALESVKDGVYNGIVMTTAFYSYLRRQRDDVNKARVFEIEGGINGGTIDGIPYTTIQSSTAIAWAGNFNNYVVHSSAFTDGEDGSAYHVETAGNIDDNTGVTHNLTSENKSALFFEQWAASGILDIRSFVELTPAAAE